MNTSRHTRSAWTLARRAGLAAALVAAITPSGQGAVTETKVAASDAAYRDIFGWDAALLGDALVVSATDGTGTQGGVGYVYRRAGTAWTQEARLTGDPTPNFDFFGWSIGLGPDVAAFGSPFDRGTDSGAVYVFRNSGGVWTREQKLPGANGKVDMAYGTAVSISGDTLFVGARFDSTVPTQGGSVFVYERQAGVWTETQRLTAPGGASGDFFGYDVAASGDTLVVGARADDLDAVGADAGSVHVFTRVAGTWSHQQMLTASDAAAGADFGVSVAVDGDVLAVGARFDDQAGADAGAVYVFQRAGTTWTQRQKLVASDASASDRLGISVALTGGVLVAGTEEDDSRAGAAYVFTGSGGSWAESTRLVASHRQANDRFGYCVAADRRTVVAGAPYQDGVAVDSGAVFVFDGFPGTRGFILPRAVAFTPAAPGKRSKPPGLTVSGVLDTGPDAAELSLPATLYVGSKSYEVPGLARSRSGRTYAFDAGGVSLLVAPDRRGGSRAAFSLRIDGDLGGALDPAGLLLLRYASASFDARCGVRLAAGSFRAGRVPATLDAPAFAPTLINARLRGDGRDRLILKGAFASAGTAPVSTPAISVSVGPRFHVTVPGDAMTRTGERLRFRGNLAGVTRLDVDFARGEVVLVAANVDLGAVATGPGGLSVGLSIGSDARSAEVRASRSGSVLSY